MGARRNRPARPITVHQSTRDFLQGEILLEPRIEIGRSGEKPPALDQHRLEPIGQPGIVSRIEIDHHVAAHNNVEGEDAVVKAGEFVRREIVRDEADGVLVAATDRPSRALAHEDPAR